MKTIGNPKKQIEYIVSRLLGKQILPIEFTKLLLEYSSIPDIDYPDIQELLMEIKKNINKDNLVNEYAIIRYLKGENQDLLTTLMLAKDLVASSIPFLLKASNIIETNRVFNLDQEIKNLKDYSDLKSRIPYNSPISEDSKIIAEKVIEFDKFVRCVSHIISLYNTFHSVIPKKIYNEKDIYKLKFYLTNLDQTLQDSNQDPSILVILKKTIDLITFTIPEHPNLDPLKTDISMELYNLFLNPDSLYSKALLSEISSTEVPNKFSLAYSEYYKEALDMYLESEGSFTNEKQTNMRYGLGIPKKQSSLSTMCYNYMYNNTNSQS